MDRRTFEGPMDWEYQDSGPFDPTSPFTHAAKSNSQNGFASPSKHSSRPNPFANLGTPSKSQPPQSSFFTPQIPSKTAAPPFRNPAFTTPRRPFDELALSEASGAEDSPAQTEVSDFPNDTPEADRMSDVTMSGFVSPSKIDKSFRYSKSPFMSSKKHAPGRGEIRANRDLSVTDFIRKRKRHNLDKDVSSVSRGRWEESDADSDDSLVPRHRTKSRGKRRTQGAPRGVIGSLFHMLDEHPNAPDNLYRWVQLMVNFFLVSIFVYIGWAVVNTVGKDIGHANESARLEIMSKITECQTQYTMNECVKKDRPALKAMCDEWYDCMMQNPESIMRVKVTVKQVAEIINEFADAMNIKAWGFFFAVLIFCAFANNLVLGGYANSKAAAPAPSQSAVASHDLSMPPESGPGFMWIPVQTPRMQRHGMLDEGTDTDSSPPKMKPILAPPYTPSGRRSPSKGDRGRSPVKYNRSPNKGSREPFAATPPEAVKVELPTAPINVAMVPDGQCICRSKSQALDGLLEWKPLTSFYMDAEPSAAAEAPLHWIMVEIGDVDGHGGKDVHVSTITGGATVEIQLEDGFGHRACDGYETVERCEVPVVSPPPPPLMLLSPSYYYTRLQVFPGPTGRDERTRPAWADHRHQQQQQFHDMMRRETGPGHRNRLVEGPETNGGTQSAIAPSFRTPDFFLPQFVEVDCDHRTLVNPLDTSLPASRPTTPDSPSQPLRPAFTTSFRPDLIRPRELSPISTAVSPHRFPPLLAVTRKLSKSRGYSSNTNIGSKKSKPPKLRASTYTLKLQFIDHRNPLAACHTAPHPPPPPLQDLIPLDFLRAEARSSQAPNADRYIYSLPPYGPLLSLPSSSTPFRQGLGTSAMDVDMDNNASSGSANQQHHSSESTPQGTSASQTSGAQSQGNPTPTSVQSANTPSTTSGTANNFGHSQNSKRRRGLGVVTPNACTECRKKRAKCDGQRPCGRCKVQKDIECVYEVPVRQSKENLRTEIESLRYRQRSSDQVFAALVRPELWEDVLTRLRGGQSVEDISEWLGGALSSGGGTLPSFNSRPDAPTVGPVAGFPGGGLGSLAAMSLGVNPVPAQPQALRPEVGQHSPWHFSPHSQTGSTRSNSHPDAMSWTADRRGPPDTRVGAWAEGLNPDQISDGLPEIQGAEQVLTPLNKPDLQKTTTTWTNITNDITLVQHLLALYFCWEYPTFASLSKEHFLQDFQDGRYRYCSPILINALLALGCRFSTQPMSRANPNDPYTSGDHFFKEALRLFAQETDHHSLTTIQALGIMSIREASCGRDSESWYYAGQSIRLAIEMGLHRILDEGDEDELAVQAATFWGAFALDHAWSLATGSLPQCSCFPHLPPKPAIIGDIEASLWVPYTDDGELSSEHQRNRMLTEPGAALQRSCQQPSNVRSVYKCFCELSELVHQSLYILHSPGKPLTARDLLSIYTQYLNWYDQIPEVLRLGHNFTPAVLFAHMYYHFAILLLFRPLIKLRINGSKVSPRDVCSQAADAIQGLLRSYSQLYTLRRTPSFVPYFVLTSSIMHLAIEATAIKTDPTQSDIETAAKLNPHVADSIKQGITDLTEMAPCHQFAEQALNILRYLAQKWDIEVEISGDKLTREEYDRLVKPHTGSLNFFAPNIREGDIMCHWGTGKATASVEDTSVVQKTADSMENPLFWPFPMQGRPILPSGNELEQAGFSVI
ncbi:hypothetical protein FZEAL_2589 [Fusarium zealandicum]|uniref:Zn(2)-C6 fungal-type domain-containing protein n=1 Tax=Fusarium zealandicum TaxID=1053134 RepID=A0A8H4UR01_9HYPO|nr:hypothetical protein FZEAL_2589 [Fusarium zealandicum]